MDAFLFTILVALTAVLFIVSFLGVFLPVLPGPAIAFAGVLIFKLLCPEVPYGWTFIAFAGVFALLAQVLDFLFTYLGAKRYGASWGGVAGAFAGLIVGVILSPSILMFFLAPIVGAICGELLTGKKIWAATKAGWGTFVGTIASMLFKFAVVLGIAAYFTYCLLMMGMAQ